jgi:hypothetical protein
VISAAFGHRTNPRVYLLHILTIVIEAGRHGGALPWQMLKQGRRIKTNTHPPLNRKESEAGSSDLQPAKLRGRRMQTNKV